MANANKPKDEHKIDPKKKIKTKRFILKKFELFASIGGYSKGAIISLRCNKTSGTPLDRYWRNRLRDATIDGCIKEISKAKPKAQVKTEK